MIWVLGLRVVGFRVNGLGFRLLGLGCIGSMGVYGVGS